MRILVWALLFGLGSPALAQQVQCTNPVTLARTDLTGAHAVLLRAMQIQRTGLNSSGFLRASFESDFLCADSVPFLRRWSISSRKPVAILPAEVMFVYNSEYPWDRNTSALWAGVGSNIQARGGAVGKWRGLRVGLYPHLTYQQNKAFKHPRSTLPGSSEFAYPFSGIDLPIRMGTSSFTTVGLGNSFVEATYSRLYSAVSTENLWLGPGHVHATLLSNNAAGFPHIRLGLAKPIDLKLFWVEAHTLYGSIKESEYGFNPSKTRLFQGTLISIEPRGMPGLHVGIARVLRDTADIGAFRISDLAKRLIDSPFFDDGGAGFDPSDRQGALFARWMLPKSGFEAYFEWAREDFPYSLLNLVLEPDYSQVWSAGFQKVNLSPNKLSRFYGEWIHLGQGAPVRGGRNIVRFAATRSPGFTHQGQMLGPTTGPGSDAQTFGYDVFDKNGRTGIMLERVRYDDDTYYEQFSRRYSESRHDVELTAEARRMQFLGPIEIEGALRYSKRWNRHFMSAIAGTEDITSETNIGTELHLRWLPKF